MSKYYVEITRKDSSPFRVRFDSYDSFHKYVIRIANTLANHTSSDGGFIDVGEKEYVGIPIQMIKTIISHGYALEDSKK